MFIIGVPGKEIEDMDGDARYEVSVLVACGAPR
jgi:hypothetical protein